MQTHYPYSQYLEETFGERTYKVAVSSGLPCPRRCAFCDERGSSSFFGQNTVSAGITEQLQKRIPQIQRRFTANKFLAHFQSHTNTQGTIEQLRNLYLEALEYPGIAGLVISTRPDSLPDPVLSLLAELSEKHSLSLELGVQSFENPTLEFLDRGHDGAASIRALKRIHSTAPRVHVCVHLIFGSPTDSPEMPERTGQLLNTHPIHGVKLHQLMVLEGAPLAARWQREHFPTLSLPQYAETVARFLEHLSPEIYIERLCATASHRDECLSPEWSKGRWGPHNKIRDYLVKRGCQQGRHCRACNVGF